MSAGSKVGSYEIVELLGVGGMGEVYRARDESLGRDVAIKLLPTAVSADPERLRRFQQEARAAAALNHPNIVGVYGFGTDNGTPYVVTELLEGESLRERLRSSPLPVRKAMDFASQLARGLAAAHEKGIIHRDLKPENLFLTRDGRLKVLDFGLAKLLDTPTAIGGSMAPTVAGATDRGTILGTLGYMAPEQLRGRPVDHRADIFSFGAILYETLSGRRAFHGETSADTISAILNHDPPELAATSRNIPPVLERLVRHCLEKNPEERFQSARDIAYDLEQISSASSTNSEVAPIQHRRSRWIYPALGILLAAGLLAGGIYLGRRSAVPPSPTFQRVSFRRGLVRFARFAPDGETIVYSASWNGAPVKIFSTRPDSPESRALDLPNGDVLAISSAGEMALSVHSKSVTVNYAEGTLASVPLGGGAPRILIEKATDADWSRDGSKLLVVRDTGERSRLEYPIGKLVLESTGWMSHPRISPHGDLIAFADHPTRFDDMGYLSIIDQTGKKKVLTPRWASIQGVAWSADGKEIWFTAAQGGNLRALYAATPAGRLRLVMRQAITLTLQDIARDGRVLLTAAIPRREIHMISAGDSEERDLSWLDWSLCTALAPDGKLALISEQGEGAGPEYSIYLRPTDGSPAAKVGTGFATDLSHDGKWVLTVTVGNHEVVLIPTAAGEARRLTDARYNVWWASLLPDGRRLILSGVESGHRPRVYLMELQGGTPRPITPEGFSFDYLSHGVTPDGRNFFARSGDGRLWLFPVEGGPGRPVSGTSGSDNIAGVSPDARSLYIYDVGETRATLCRLDLATGARQAIRKIGPADAAAVTTVGPIVSSADGKSYVYSYARALSDLFLVDGLR